MRILTIHNHYQQLGGEDTIFTTESDLLESWGHQVRRYTIHNDQVKELGSLALAKKTLWNNEVYHDLRELIRQERPEITHFHNTFPLISPSAYYAAKAEGVPVVQTLHNFRLLCANGLFFRDGQVCEDCLDKRVPWPGIVHACYRRDRMASGAVAAMVKLHDLLGTWHQAVDVFIAYSHFALKKFVEGGLPEEKLEFKTNFLYPAPEIGSGRGDYALFVGRLAPEKGTGTLLAAWKHLDGKIPLKILGDGPLAPQVVEAAQQLSGVEWLGRRPLEEVYTLMGEAAFLVISSEWYETFGRVGIEALAKGTPLLVANIGALSELVIDDYNGFRFRAGDHRDLANKVEWLLNHPEILPRMRQASRTEFETKYMALDNYHRLMEIYRLARCRQQTAA